MTSIAERTISALRANHDDLAKIVPGLSDEQLTTTSGASEWTVADVLSHLGSGAEITLAGFRPALEGGEMPPDDFNQSVWDRWNALPPREQADTFLERNADLVAALDRLDDDTRETAEIDLGFLPQPIPLSGAMGMRLNEVVLHGWDVRIPFDQAATLPEDQAELLAEHLTGDLKFMLGFAAKTKRLQEPVTVAIADSGYLMELGDDAVLVKGDAAKATATLNGPLESLMRLISGRLGPERTPDGVTVTGNAGIDDLRAVFPGF